MSVSAELLRYAVGGLLNSLVGYLAFLVALHVFSLSISASNVIAYAAGLTVAYMLNKNFVFQGRPHSMALVWKFLFGFAIAFGTNLLVLHGAGALLHLRAELAQLAAMAAYTVTFYLMSKYFVFRVPAD